MLVQPQLASGKERINAYLFPPCALVTATVQLTMMSTAKRNSEFVANFACQGGALCKAQVMSISRTAAADEARLLGDLSRVLPVAQSARLGKRQDAFVDTARLRPDSGHF